MLHASGAWKAAQYALLAAGLPAYRLTTFTVHTGHDRGPGLHHYWVFVVDRT